MTNTQITTAYAELLAFLLAKRAMFARLMEDAPELAAAQAGKIDRLITALCEVATLAYLGAELVAKARLAQNGAEGGETPHRGGKAGF